MKITSKKTIAAVIASAFIMVGAAAPFAAQAAQQNVQRPAQHQRQADPAQIADRIANTFGVSKLAVLKYNAGGTSFRDLARASYLALASGKSLDEVMALKTADNTWKDVAAALNITKEQRKAAKQTIFANRLQYRFTIDKQTTAALLQEGYKPHQIVMAAVLAKQANKSVTDVIKMKTANNKWADVAKELGIDAQTFKQDVRQVKHFFPHKKAAKTQHQQAQQK